MSGFAGAVHLGGGSIDPEAFRQLAGALAFRGPDGGSAWTHGPSAFAYAHLRTGPGSAPQPATLDGSAWIVCHARIDARDDLVRELRGEGRAVSPAAPDADLLLHAYAAWGDDLPARVLGDFAFALWDTFRRRLLLARDRFGVRPLYHARAGEALVFGNTLDAVRAYPDVGAGLNDTAIADFLVFGQNQDPATTSFASISSVPPAHRLTAEGGEVWVDRYWELPAGAEPLRYRKIGEYVEHFRTVFGRAVRDRVPAGPCAILLSGGRDSTAVAAAALEGPAGERPELRAHTIVYDRLIPDEEREFSTLAAVSLGIPIRHHPADGYALLERWDDPALRRPEPADNPLPALDGDFYAAVAADARVCLTGDGGDPTLSESRSRLAKLMEERRWAAFLAESLAYAWHHRRIPRPGFRTLRRDRAASAPWTPFPAWIDEDFAREARLRERWEALAARPRSTHPLRPEAHARLASPFWAHWFEQYDPGFTRLPLEFRHPFFDVRLVSLLLSIPPVQWYNDKGLLRIGMRGKLPRRLLRRPKTPLAGDPVRARLEARGWTPPPLPPLSGAVRRWVDPAKVPAYAGGSAGAGAGAPGLDFRPVELAAWLQTSRAGY